MRGFGMSDDNQARIDQIEADIHEMFSVYGGLYDGVRDVVVDILDKVKGRAEGEYDQHDMDLLAIARRLTDLVLVVAEKIEKTDHD
jgi:hypothetical protein